MLEALEQGYAQIILLPQSVQMWMNWLNIVFLMGLFFVKNHRAARWSLVAYLAGFLVGAVIFYYTVSIALLGVTHIVCWLPLLIYLVRTKAIKWQLQVSSVYEVWVILLALTIAISLFFDFRDLFNIIAS